MIENGDNENTYCCKEIFGLHPVYKNRVLDLVIEKKTEQNWNRRNLNLPSAASRAATLPPDHHWYKHILKTHIF